MIGMLWFDNDPNHTLEAKVRGALAHYRSRYGPPGGLVMVNPANFEPGIIIPGIEIRESKVILPNHIYVIHPEKGG